MEVKESYGGYEKTARLQDFNSPDGRAECFVPAWYAGTARSRNAGEDNSAIRIFNQAPVLFNNVF